MSKDTVSNSRSAGLHLKSGNCLGKMLAAMIKALPKSQQKALKVIEKKESDWHKVRREAFIKRYGRIFPILFKCVECDEPIAEIMQICPWCGSQRNRFDTQSRFNYICPRCHKGILSEWRFCPWCYGPGFDAPTSVRSAGVRYHALCKYCDGKLMRFMRYCPWCHRKVCRPWQIRPFSEICGSCGWSIDSDFWNYCPWCGQNLMQ